MERIYLDWNATAPMLAEAREAMIGALGTAYGNASSVHHEGQVARTLVERARRAVADAVGARAQGVILTGGATESNNQVLRHHARVTLGAHLVATAVDHPSVIEVLGDLGRTGVSTALWPVDSAGRLDLNWLAGQCAAGAADTAEGSQRPTLVSVMWANNEIGNIYPVADIAALAHDGGALLHVDATQALGRTALDFEASGADIMTLSFHKMGGPKGIGAIIVREGLEIEATLAGGHQERGRRPGTENVPAAAGLIAAMAALRAQHDAWHRALAHKREIFLGALTEQVQGFGLRGDLAHCLPNTLNVAFDGIDGEDLLLALDLEGVAASSGSACTAGSLEPSHVVLAMGFSEADARRSVRFSFGPSTEDVHLLEAARRLGVVVRRLRL